ncbi:hypothetical protein Hanom_Chr16g01421171 [Helianthus anomalus]
MYYHLLFLQQYSFSFFNFLKFFKILLLLPLKSKYVSILIFQKKKLKTNYTRNLTTLCELPQFTILMQKQSELPLTTNYFPIVISKHLSLFQSKWFFRKN